MVSLTRLNTHPIIVNCDLIRFVEASPDTMLTLITGEKIVVLESCEQVVAKAAKWRAALLRSAFPEDAAHASAEAASSALAAAGAYKAELAARKPERQLSD